MRHVSLRFLVPTAVLFVVTFVSVGIVSSTLLERQVVRQADRQVRRELRLMQSSLTTRSRTRRTCWR